MESCIFSSVYSEGEAESNRANFFIPGFAKTVRNFVCTLTGKQRVARADVTPEQTLSQALFLFTTF